MERLFDQASLIKILQDGVKKPNPIIFNSQEVKIQLAGNTSSNTTTEFPVATNV